MDSINSYLFISSMLFCLGLFGVITRRNAIAVLMGVELILNAANLNFVAFSRFGGMNMDVSESIPPKFEWVSVVGTLSA